MEAGLPYLGLKSTRSSALSACANLHWKFQVTLYVAPTAEVARLFTQKRPEPVIGELALRPWQEPVRFQVRIEAPDDEAFR